MFRRFVLIAAGIGALTSTPPALAQEFEDSLELDDDLVEVPAIDVDRDRPMDLYVPGDDHDDDGETSLRVEVELTSEIDTFDNLDLRALDERDTQSIIDSDDRSTLGHSGLIADIEISPVRELELELTLDVDLLWGEEPPGRTLGGAGKIDIARVNAAYRLLDTDWIDVELRIGRQFFAIGGVPDDYFLSGIADAITGTIDFGVGGSVRGLILDVFSASEMPESGYFRYQDGLESVFGQRGETNTYRSGLVYENVDDLVDGLTFKAWYFYASVGGGGHNTTGSDISEGGPIGGVGNFRDRDYLMLFGGRVGHRIDIGDFGYVRPFAELARTEGIDRKEPVVPDVDTAGNAFGVGVELELDITPEVRVALLADWRRFDGAAYSVGGPQFRHGFVSFGADRVGGLASGRLSGWRPSATLDTSGVRQAPDDVARSAGTDFTHAGIELGLWDTTLAFDFWVYTDTRTSSFDQSTIDDIDPPFGYSREEFAAQRRVGLRLGTEIDVRLEQAFGDHFSLFGEYGLFSPGDYYGIEVSRVNAFDTESPRLGGQIGLWAVRAGAEVGLGVRRARQ